MGKNNKRGQLVVISGPSGGGKSTVITEVRNQRSGLCFSVSYTTREPRQNEENGVQYNFVSRETFLQMIEQERFVEYACYQGNYYGTSKDAVDRLLEEGKDVLLDIEVQGAAAIRKLYPEANIAAIDYDPGASEVNQLNRIKLMLATAQKNLHRKK